MADGSFLMSGKKVRVIYNIRKIYLLSVIPLPKKLPSAICTTVCIVIKPNITFSLQNYLLLFCTLVFFSYLCTQKYMVFFVRYERTEQIDCCKDGGEAADMGSGYHAVRGGGIVLPHAEGH